MLENETLDNGSTDLNQDNDITNGGNADDSIDEILKSLEEEEDDNSWENKDEENKNKDEKKGFFKKVGNLEFKTEEEYDSWAKKNYGEKLNLQGEIKKLTQVKDTKVVVDDKKPEDINALMWRIKAETFFDEYPDAQGYKEEIAAFLRSGKAVDKNGKPSFKIAYALSLRAYGKVKDNSSDDNKNNVKKLMQTGGGNASSTSDVTYKEKSEVDSLDDFANRALRGGLR